VKACDSMQIREVLDLTVCNFRQYTCS